MRHSAGKDVHAPGLYVHIEPDEIWLGVGLWRPDGPTLRRLRQTMADDPRGWKRARDAKSFAAHWERDLEDTLKRPPQGFEADHPLVDDLKLKSHVAKSDLTRDDLLAADVVERVLARFQAARPFMRWVSQAAGHPF